MKSWQGSPTESCSDCVYLHSANVPAGNRLTFIGYTYYIATIIMPRKVTTYVTAVAVQEPVLTAWDYRCCRSSSLHPFRNYQRWELIVRIPETKAVEASSYRGVGAKDRQRTQTHPVSVEGVTSSWLLIPISFVKLWVLREFLVQLPHFSRIMNIMQSMIII